MSEEVTIKIKPFYGELIGYMAFADGLEVSDQVIDSSMKFVGPAGSGGFVVWFHDYENLVFIRVYPGSGSIWIDEFRDGESTNTQYAYPINYNDNLWYDVRAETDSSSGDIDVFINDVKIFTHHVNTNFHIGKSGLLSGNSGVYFDDFSLQEVSN